MLVFVYNLLWPVIFIFFLPGVIYKLIRRGGYKKNYMERFGFFSKAAKAKLLKSESPIWIHAVSVGETQLAIDFIEKWTTRRPEINFVLSTTTTTGQALARSKVSPHISVVFCPLDMKMFVKKHIELIKPSALIIFETEIWPNLIRLTRKSGAKVAIVNARISDRSFSGYMKYRRFIEPFLSDVSVICAQSKLDLERLNLICPSVEAVETGTMKFDKVVNTSECKLDMSQFFGSGNFTILLAASTHPGEERIIAETFKKLYIEFPMLRLVLVPRHAERAGEVSSILKELQLPFIRRTEGNTEKKVVDCLLVDTTGELLAFIQHSDVVMMGKTFGGHDEGQNIIEPAIFGKPIVIGKELRNFRYITKVMLENEAIIKLGSDNELESVLRILIESPEERQKFGAKAKKVVLENRGATNNTIDILEELICVE